MASYNHSQSTHCSHLFRARARATQRQRILNPCQPNLPIALRHPLQFILLLDGIAVTATLRGVDQLLSQALSNGLDVSEAGLARTDGQERYGLVHPAQRRHVDGLTTDGSGTADTCGVLAGAAVDDGIDGDLERVRVGCYVDLLVVSISDYSSWRGNGYFLRDFVGDVGADLVVVCE